VVLRAPEKINMPVYIASPFKPTPRLLVAGTPEYLFGKYSSTVAPTQGNILKDSGDGSTSTFVIQILSGNVPTVDSLFTSVGTANAAGAYDLTNVVILSVSSPSNPDTGIYTITVAGSGNSAAAADAGQFYVPVPEIAEALGAISDAPVSSAPVTSAVAGPDNTGKSLSVTVKLPATTTAHPSDLTGVTVVLQGANLDLNSEYNTIATVASSVAAGSTTDWQSGQGDTATGTLAAGSVLMPNFRHYRLQVTAATSSGGGGGYIIGKILS
jgi:hypothetical protein